MRKLLSTLVFMTITIMFVVAQGTSNNNEGELLGLFSVGENHQVKFSQGNLQYQPSTHTWRFAKEQWETIGIINDTYLMEIQKAVTSTYMETTTEMVPTSLCPDQIDHNLWLDIFWFGSSGKNELFPEIKCDQVKMIKPDKDLDYDWGKYCSISNGGNQAGLWRTLSAEEWNYLFFERANAQELFGFITIEKITGLVILPDNYKELVNDTSLYPSKDQDIRKRGKNYYNKNKNNFDNAKVISQEQWSKMQEAGAVFLPNVSLWIEKEITIEVSQVNKYSIQGNSNAPNSIRSKIKLLTSEGFYWSWSRKGMMYNCLNFNNEFIYPQALKENIYRLPVRLVKDVK